MKPMLKPGVVTLELWNSLFETDPSYTKDFKRAGGFTGTAITPMLAAFRLTEQFGPMGDGWGLECQDIRTHDLPACGETLVYILVGLWYMKDGRRCVAGPQWGGDKIMSTGKSGTRGDDEAYKKAMTDGFLKCASYLGIGADIHSGMFDDVKYFNNLEAKFSEKEKPAKAAGSSHDDINKLWMKLYEAGQKRGLDADKLRESAKEKMKEWVGGMAANDPARIPIISMNLKAWIDELEKPKQDDAEKP